MKSINFKAGIRITKQEAVSINYKIFEAIKEYNYLNIK